jgi:rubrerythrin
MMSGISAGVRRVFRTGRRCVRHECRHCGTNVGSDTDQCPACESPDIVRYEIV